MNLSSTVVLLRENKGIIEVFMVKRNSKSSFMADAYVFPGGKVDDNDRAIDLCKTYCTNSLDDIAILPHTENSNSFYIAAIRELFEEAGILLARNSNGSIVTFENIEDANRFEEHRHNIHDGKLSLFEMLEKENLTLDLSIIKPYSHWITPDFESKRFDTWFFIATIPCNQTPLHDNSETVHSEWISPINAIEKYRLAEILLVPPTLKTLEELMAFKTISDIETFASSKNKPPILPHYFVKEDIFTLVLPGDPEYPYNSYGGIDGETRMKLKDGQWYTI